MNDDFIVLFIIFYVENIFFSSCIQETVYRSNIRVCFKIFRKEINMAVCNKDLTIDVSCR